MNATAAITAEAATVGTAVTFRPEFSARLVGLVFMIDGPVLVAHPNNGGYEYVSVKIRTANGRWAYRNARLSDLVAA